MSEDEGKFSTEDIGAIIQNSAGGTQASGDVTARQAARAKSRDKRQEGRADKKAERAEAAKQVTKTDKSTQDKLAQGQMLEKMQKSMSGMGAAQQAAPYQLEPEKDFQARSQNYVRQLMNLGGKSQG